MERVGASFLADRDFLLEVLLVHATGLESSISRLSDWMGVASFTSSAVKTFAVCVVMWGARVVELATLRGFCQPAATSSRESRFFAPFCWFGPLTALFGCGGPNSFPVPAVVQSI